MRLSKFLLISTIFLWGALAFPAKAQILEINGSDYALSEAQISSWTVEKNSLIFNPKYFSEAENINLCQINKSAACRLTLPFKDELHFKKHSIPNFDENAIYNFVKDLSRTYNKDPENAKLKIENGLVTTFSLSQNGFKINDEKSVEMVRNYLTQKDYSKKLILPMEITQPEISMDKIENMGITELIGEGRSNFKGSPKNRIFNITVATNRFNGVLIKPQEEFSFVKILGEVDGEHGYLPELVIKKDKTEPEFGGGICQVSTTTFRAAINSGLEITARRNHAYPVSYYNPQGMDATVYVPRPDLRFINNTPGYILIQTKIEGTELIFDFYGTNDGRKINIIGPKILERNPDGSMKTTFTQQILDQNGNLIREDIFNSAYDSPSKYPHPGATEVLKKKPDGWSDKEWKNYKKINNL